MLLAQLIECYLSFFSSAQEILAMSFIVVRHINASAESSFASSRNHHEPRGTLRGFIDGGIQLIEYNGGERIKWRFIEDEPEDIFMGAHMDVRHVLFPGYSSTIKAIAEIDPDRLLSL
jgi:hypothetical protein